MDNTEQKEVKTKLKFDSFEEKLGSWSWYFRDFWEMGGFDSIYSKLKFESGRGKKAYSYFGTISKRYILGLLMKDEKYLKQTTSYEDISESIEEREDMTYTIDSTTFSMDEFIKNLSEGIKTELNDENLPPKKKLTENERKVGNALIDILESWEIIFKSMDGGSKYNKN